jgi:hypothetical protein
MLAALMIGHHFSISAFCSALLDFVGHARKMFADRPQRRFRF